MKVGQFTIESVIGRGGMSVVYLAHDLAGSAVALKILNNDPTMLNGTAKARFLREAEILQRVDHEGVVRLIEVGRHAEQMYIAMEYLEGVTLGDIRRSGLISDPSFILAVGKEITEALTALHAAGIKHRDLKPDNVLVQPSGRVVLLDFGIARIEDRAITSTGLVLGSPGYVAPEVLSGRPISEAADQYSLGRSLFELCAARAPALLPKGLSPLERFNRRLEIDWTRFPTSKRWVEVERVLRRMLATKPNARFRSASACHLALIEALRRLRPADGTRRIIKNIVEQAGVESRDPWSDSALVSPVVTKDAEVPTRDAERTQPSFARIAQVLTALAAGLVVSAATLVGLGNSEKVLRTPDTPTSASVALGKKLHDEAIEHLAAGRIDFAEQTLERCVQNTPEKSCQLRLHALRLMTGRPGIRLQ